MIINSIVDCLSTFLCIDIRHPKYLKFRRSVSMFLKFLSVWNSFVFRWLLFAAEKTGIQTKTQKKWNKITKSNAVDWFQETSDSIESDLIFQMVSTQNKPLPTHMDMVGPYLVPLDRWKHEISLLIKDPNGSGNKICKFVTINVRQQCAYHTDMVRINNSNVNSNNIQWYPHTKYSPFQRCNTQTNMNVNV